MWNPIDIHSTEIDFNGHGARPSGDLCDTLKRIPTAIEC